jgi:hypothetical protein
VRKKSDASPKYPSVAVVAVLHLPCRKGQDLERRVADPVLVKQQFLHRTDDRFVVGGLLAGNKMGREKLLLGPTLPDVEIIDIRFFLSKQRFSRNHPPKAADGLMRSVKRRAPRDSHRRRGRDCRSNLLRFFPPNRIPRNPYRAKTRIFAHALETPCTPCLTRSPAWTARAGARMRNGGRISSSPGGSRCRNGEGPDRG